MAIFQILYNNNQCKCIIDCILFYMWQNFESTYGIAWCLNKFSLYVSKILSNNILPKILWIIMAKEFISWILSYLFGFNRKFSTRWINATLHHLRLVFIFNFDFRINICSSYLKVSSLRQIHLIISFGFSFLMSKNIK